MAFVMAATAPSSWPVRQQRRHAAAAAANARIENALAEVLDKLMQVDARIGRLEQRFGASFVKPPPGFDTLEADSQSTMPEDGRCEHLADYRDLVKTLSRRDEVVDHLQLAPLPASEPDPKGVDCKGDEVNDKGVAKMGLPCELYELGGEDYACDDACKESDMTDEGGSNVSVKGRSLTCNMDRGKGRCGAVRSRSKRQDLGGDGELMRAILDKAREVSENFRLMSDSERRMSLTFEAACANVADSG
eukprot:TRINITY_DN17949_c0_g2_i1.p1 TRINITY_DN17949_c0_g2~~TRINITY_DN17949_c0_g2_i1.p1  ORF type:complete len:247 (+),score=50.46 TRINITY_DN17949_c0_g2_i1:67-807(+)